MLTDRELDILLRRNRGDTQETIAKALKITQAAVSQFEKSAHKKILDAEKITKICKSEKITTKETVTSSKVLYRGEKK